jgi:hypothetical protein
MLNAECQLDSHQIRRIRAMFSAYRAIGEASVGLLPQKKHPSKLATWRELVTLCAFLAKRVACFTSATSAFKRQQET